jgi:hypothetical protein
VKKENSYNTDGGYCNSLYPALWQHAVFELLGAVLNSYSQGIATNLKAGIDNLLIPDDIFTIGQSLCHNLINFKPI